MISTLFLISLAVAIITIVWFFSIEMDFHKDVEELRLDEVNQTQDTNIFKLKD